MNQHRRKYWILRANRVLLALEGIVIGLGCACVICSFRLARDHAAPVLSSWLAGWKDNWWIAPLWLLVLVAAARFLGWLV